MSLSATMKARKRQMLNNIVKLMRFQLRNRKNVILGWTVGSFALMFLYMILFTSMQDVAQAKFDAMPEELLEVFGISSFAAMSNWVSYFGMIFGIFILIISFFSATFTGSLIFNEEKSKSIEFLNSLPVSRVEIFLSKVLTAFVGVTIVLLASCSSALICGFINGGETFVLVDVLSIMKVSGFIPYIFMGAALLIGGFTTRASTSMLASAAVIGLYMIGYLGGLLENDILTKISPFKVFDSTHALGMSNETFIMLGIFFALMVAMIMTGGWIYNKRDFNI